MSTAGQERLSAQDLRPTRVPDVDGARLAAEAHRQSALVAAGPAAESDQAWVDDLTDWPDG